MDWINIKHKTPENGERVLTFPGWATCGGIGIDEWVEQYGCFLMGIEEGCRVTHWQPLPETKTIPPTP